MKAIVTFLNQEYKLKASEAYTHGKLVRKLMFTFPGNTSPNGYVQSSGKEKTVWLHTHSSKYPLKQNEVLFLSDLLTQFEMYWLNTYSE